MGGQRGIWHEGWKAVTRHQTGEPTTTATVGALPPRPTTMPKCATSPRRSPERLRAMVDLWWEEARRYGVLPLDDRAQARAFARDPATDGATGVRDVARDPAADAGLRPELRDAAVPDRGAGRAARGRRGGGALRLWPAGGGFLLYLEDGRLSSTTTSPGGIRAALASRCRPGARLAAELYPRRGAARLGWPRTGARSEPARCRWGSRPGSASSARNAGMNYPSPVSAAYRAPVPLHRRARPGGDHAGRSGPRRGRGAVGGGAAAAVGPARRACTTCAGGSRH